VTERYRSAIGPRQTCVTFFLSAAIAAEFVRAKAEVMVTAGSAVHHGQRTISIISIVFAIANDLASSLAACLAERAATSLV
jgi:hypothetical protein